jgi:hypothetical protein
MELTTYVHAHVATAQQGAQQPSAPNKPLSGQPIAYQPLFQPGWQQVQTAGVVNQQPPQSPFVYGSMALPAQQGAQQSQFQPAGWQQQTAATVGTQQPPQSPFVYGAMGPRTILMPVPPAQCVLVRSVDRRAEDVDDYCMLSFFSLLFCTVCCCCAAPAVYYSYLVRQARTFHNYEMALRNQAQAKLCSVLAIVFGVTVYVIFLCLLLPIYFVVQK